MSTIRHLPRFREARAELAVLAEREEWPRERIAAYQLARINALWAHAVAHVPHYRELRARMGLPDRFRNLDEFLSGVPILTTDVVRDGRTALFSERADLGRWEQTSGSSGIPAFIYWSGESNREVQRARYRLYASWGVDVFDRTTCLMGPATWKRGPRGMFRRAQWWAHSRLRRRQWLFVPRLGTEEVPSVLARIAAFRPVMIYGYSRTLQVLADESAASGRKWPDLRLVVLTSEPSPPALRAAVTRGFGVPTAVEYGATECGLIAGEGPDGQLRVREDMVLMETLPRPDGRYDIVVTVLVNSSFPLIRYRIGDVTDAPLEAGERGFAVLRSIYGRDDDFLVARRGGLVDSMAVEDVVFRLRGVRAFRARQSREGGVVLSVELAPGAAAFDPARIVRPLREMLEGQPVVVEAVPAIPASESGKRRVVVSELARRGGPNGDGTDGDGAGR